MAGPPGQLRQRLIGGQAQAALGVAVEPRYVRGPRARRVDRACMGDDGDGADVALGRAKAEVLMHAHVEREHPRAH